MGRRGGQGLQNRPIYQTRLRWVRFVHCIPEMVARKAHASYRYCFGAPYVCDLLAGDTCAAGAFAHPAFLKESHFLNLHSSSNHDLGWRSLLTIPQNRSSSRAAR